MATREESPSHLTEDKQVHGIFGPTFVWGTEMRLGTDDDHKVIETFLMGFNISWPVQVHTANNLQLSYPSVQKTLSTLASRNIVRVHCSVWLHSYSK